METKGRPAVFAVVLVSSPPASSTAHTCTEPPRALQVALPSSGKGTGGTQEARRPLGGPRPHRSLGLSPSVCQVIGVYDYTAQNDDELAFSKGQVINVLNKEDPDWWKGEVHGQVGLFPSNYVKLTTDMDPSQQCKCPGRPVASPLWRLTVKHAALL